jgi:hypothetical protein
MLNITSQEGAIKIWKLGFVSCNITSLTYFDFHYLRDIWRKKYTEKKMHY